MATSTGSSGQGASAVRLPGGPLGGDFDSGHITLKPSQVAECLRACIQAGEPAMIHGDPGLGKTHVVGQVARELFGVDWATERDAETEGEEEETADALARAEKGEDTAFFRKFILSQREPTDAMGLPVVEKVQVQVGGKDGKDGKVKWNGQYTTAWARPDVFPTEGKGVFFLDEMPQAVPMLQAPARQLLTERRFGPHELPEGWAVVAAGNYPHNRAGSSKLLTHVGSAIIHLHMVPDLDDLMAWGARTGELRPEVMAFLRFRPELLHKFSTDADTFPCPRTWHKLSNLVGVNPPQTIAYALYSGAVGEGAAGEFNSFMQVFKTLPDVDEVLAQPKTHPVPRQDNVGTLYALAGALARVATRKNVSAVLTYLERMGTEYSVFAVRDATRRDEKLMETQAWQQWALKHSRVLGVSA